MKYQIMPPLSEEDFSALKADIAARGVLVPIEYDDQGNVLDGHHRIRACEELSIKKWPKFVRKGLSEAEKRLHARQLNLARRHLNQAQKRDLLLAQLKDTPTKSNRQIAEGLQVDHKTVQAVRAEAEATGEIPQLNKTMGADGKERRKPIRTSFFDPSPKAVRVAAGNSDTEWYTPAQYVELARQVMGEIDLDPASSEQAQRTVKAKKFFTQEDDGLKQSWLGRVWCNPPYNQPDIVYFADKMIGEVNARNVIEAVMLTNNYTDAGWFHALAESAAAICFTRGRIKFVRADGATGSPTNGQAFFYFGKKIEKFRKVFQEVGLVVTL